MFRESGNKTTFSNIFPSLTEIEAAYLKQFLTMEALKHDALVSNCSVVLVLAALNNQLSLASKLIAAGCSVYVKVDDNQSLLAYAAERGKDGIVSLLIEAGADRFLADEEEKALLSAVAQHRKATMTILLKHRPFDPVKDERTFLLCAEYDDVDYLKKFLSTSASSEQCLIKALKGAINFKAVNTTSLLLKSMSKEVMTKALADVDLLKSDEKILKILRKNGVQIPDKPPVLEVATIIYPLKNLDEVDAVFMLYRLAEESAIGKGIKTYAITMTVNADGLYQPLEKSQIFDRVLHARRNCEGRLGYLGYFQDIGIRIEDSNRITKLDVTKYLDIFKLSKVEVFAKLDQLATPGAGIQVSKSHYTNFSTSSTKQITDDKRFKKAEQNEQGLLWVADSMSYISDETLAAYGFKASQCRRDKIGLDHFVYIHHETAPLNKAMPK